MTVPRGLRVSPTARITRTRHFDYSDPYHAESADSELISQTLADLSREGSEYFGLVGADPSRPRKRIDRRNPATVKLGELLPSFNDWLDLVPTAAALDSLYAPDSSHLPNGKPLDPALAMWLRSIADGRGIRSRAGVVREILVDSARASKESQAWLSLASGAGQPVMSAVEQLSEFECALPTMTFVDRDESALDLLERYARQRGLSEQVSVKNANILNRRGMADTEGLLRRPLNLLRKSNGSQPRVAEASFDVVEAIGIVEYLQRNDWLYRYGKVMKARLPMAGAVTFLSNAYRLVKPGGTLLTSNMLLTHPQLEFTLNVIQWPHIQPRSVDDMVSIFDAAGASGELDVILPADGVYGVYAIHKPA